MAHYKKYHISDVKKLLEHDNRKNTNERENVDKSRSYLNWNLSNQSSETLVFSRKIGILILVPYVFSLVFALMS